MINPSLIMLYVFIFLFAILYFNKYRLKTIFLRLKKPEKEKYVKICPKCGSVNVGTDFSNPVVWDYGTPSKYKCKSCGYLSNVFPEVLQEQTHQYMKELNAQIKKGKLKFKKEELIDASTGFYAGIWEVITGLFLLPIFLLLLIVYLVRSPFSYDVILEQNTTLIIISLLGTVFLIYLTFKTIKYVRNR